MGEVRANARQKCRQAVRSGARWLLAGMMVIGGQPALAVVNSDSEPRSDAAAGQPSVRADSAVLDRARRLLARQQASQAYALLAPYEYDWAGDPEYDQLLGSAAMASGRPDEAAMAFERAVAVDSGGAAARTALARAYYQAGEHELARRELGRLGLTGLPRDDVLDFDRYPAPAGTPGPRRTTFRYLVMLDAGYDSNANAGTDDDRFLGVALGNRNVEKDSAYGYVAHGGYLRVPLGQYWDYDFGFNLVQRRNLSATFANIDRIGLSNDFVYRKGRTELNFGAGLYTSFLDSRFPYDGFYSQSGANLDFGSRWFLGDSAWRLGTDVTLTAIRHESSTRIFDVDQLLLDGVMEYLGRGSIPSFGLVLTLGESQARQDDSPYGRSLYGARFTSSWFVGRPNRMYLNVGVARSDYDGAFFGDSRHDMQYSAGLSAILHVFPSRQWTMIPHIAQIVNNSDVSLFDYDRTEIGLAFRWLSD